MDISKHISKADLFSFTVFGIFFPILGTFFLLSAVVYPFLLLLSIFFFWAGLPFSRRCKRLKRAFAFLQKTPTATFAEIAQALKKKPEKLRKDMHWAVKVGVLRHTKIDTERDVLVSTAPPPPQEELATVPCPNCGAPVTISTKLGGQCEYCDSWLPGTE